MRRSFVICLGILALLSGCGRQHKAETTVEDFVEANAVGDVKILHIGRLDSTVNVTDSLMQVMRDRVEKSPNWKNGISYAPYQRSAKKPLYYVPVKYVEKNDTLTGAFYLSGDLKTVAGFI